jgi:hypothetical protein
MATVIQVKRGTASAWTSANTVLTAGEIGFESDTKKMKVGDGTTAWTSLGYTATDGDITAVVAGTGLSGGATSGSATLSIDSTVATLTGTQTLTNKTLTTPIISSISNTGTLTLPTSTGTIALTSDITVTASSTTTLTNKTLTTPTLDDPKINLAFDAETASYTGVLANNGQVVTMNNASANTFSIPTNASVAYPVGTQINVLQIGAGQTTIQAVTSGTTAILSTAATAAAPKIRARYGMATCIKAATDTWYVVGDIV